MYHTPYSTSITKYMAALKESKVIGHVVKYGFEVGENFTLECDY